jgi:hypothetical protein
MVPWAVCIAPSRVHSVSLRAAIACETRRATASARSHKQLFPVLLYSKPTGPPNWGQLGRQLGAQTISNRLRTGSTRGWASGGAPAATHN